jgi:D-alanine-D-alanine ligase
MNELQLIILCGGNSSEREVSLSTGKAIYDCLKASLNVELLQYENRIESYIPQLKKADLVFIALHGGEGENGKIQSIFEENGIKYTGSDSISSALAMDKNTTKVIGERLNISTPNWLMYNKGENIEALKNEITRLEYPIVVKPSNEGSTVGLSIVQSENECKLAINLALKYSDEIMIEEFIPGRELTVGILGQEFLPIVEIIPKHDLYDYDCKYKSGMSEYICPAEIDNDLAENMQKDALKLHNGLGCRHYSRVDYRLNEKGVYYMLEINTLPGMTSTSLIPKAGKANNISFEELLKKIIRLAK